MIFNDWLPALIVISSLVTGVVIFFLEEERARLRMGLNLAGAIIKLVMVGVLLWGVFHDGVYEMGFSMGTNLRFVLRADSLSVLFVTLSSLLWFVTTIYAVGYMEGSRNRSRFFGVFSLCVSATTGIAMAGNLLTFLVFYEILTLSTYPLVVHKGTQEALRVGRIYLGYTLGGGMLLLVTIIWLQSIVGPVDFQEVGALAAHASEYRFELTAIFAMFIVGLGVKSALFPLHSWLPMAMVAPAPVSALLHAVAVVKAGVFGIVRVVYDVFGIGFANELGVLTPLSWAAAFTIIYGSMRALFQEDLKRRLAFSTVSQVSYIVLGTSVFGPLATLGGLAHLVHQGLMKITLFFCAGTFAETLGVHKVNEMDGVGKRMPWTTSAFTVAALGMIGLPPLAGFYSKWYLGLGALEAGRGELIGVLLGSSLLNAMYFLPIVYAVWFKKRRDPWPQERKHKGFEAPWMLVIPPVVTAASVILVGVFANSSFSPLQWAQLIVERIYAP